MPRPSPETQTIRRIVERMSDDDLRAHGPTDLKGAVEKAGLSFAAVREKVNNELARARRRRVIRKGRGRRIAADDADEDAEFQRLFKLFTQLTDFQDCYFETWVEARAVVEEVIALLEGFGSRKALMSAIQIKIEDEEARARKG